MQTSLNRKHSGADLVEVLPGKIRTIRKLLLLMYPSQQHTIMVSRPNV
jgi:hypothetical protein